MDKIKLDFCGFWEGFDKDNNLFTDILRKKFQVEITDKPDFLIASPLGQPYTYLDYDCVRIFFTGEPVVPDFNLFDYAIGFDRISFPDRVTKGRYYRFPLCFFRKEDIDGADMDGLTYEQAKEVLSKKKYFCNFLYGHKSPLGEREMIFEEIQKYKRVDSAGTFLNNMPDGTVIPYKFNTKIGFLRDYKFTIACESISYPGFITEKIIDPLFANSVPVYYGDPFVSLEFNPEAMINLQAYPTLEEGIEKLKEVDQDDEAYLRMLTQPKFATEDYMDKLYEGLEEFLFSIFSQRPEDAYRRLRFFIPERHEEHLKEWRRYRGSFEQKVFNKLHRWF